MSITDNCEVRSYQCKNGACINETLICDGKRDCQDGDDEENCSKFTALKLHVNEYFQKNSINKIKVIIFSFINFH